MTPADLFINYTFRIVPIVILAMIMVSATNAIIKHSNDPGPSRAEKREMRRQAEYEAQRKAEQKYAKQNRRVRFLPETDVPDLDNYKRATKKDPSDRTRGLIDRFHAIESAYTAVETNPATLLDMPAILDVSYRATARFHEALATARQAVEHAEKALHRRGTIAEKKASRWEKAISDCETAWQKAKDSALTIGIPGTSARERERAHKLLALILDESVSDGERRNARTSLESIMAASGLAAPAVEKVHGAIEARLALAASARRALEA